MVLLLHLGYLWYFISFVFCCGLVLIFGLLIVVWLLTSCCFGFRFVCCLCLLVCFEFAVLFAGCDLLGFGDCVLVVLRCGGCRLGLLAVIRYV